MPPSSSGQGHLVFSQRITGSNPVGGAKSYSLTNFALDDILLRMNESKIRNQRMWEKWRRAGAVKNIDTVRQRAKGEIRFVTNPQDFNPRRVGVQRGILVEDVPNFGIIPSDIPMSRHLFDAYGNAETEISARCIIRMCQQRESWEPFTSDDIERFYQEGGWKDGFCFNQLVDPGTGFGINGSYPIGGGWIVKREGKYHVTTAFVEAAYKASHEVPVG